MIGSYFTKTMNYFFNGKLSKLYRNDLVSIPPVLRESDLTDEERRTHATELLDIYKGFGIEYLKTSIKENFKSQTTQVPMLNLVVSLPLLKKFIDSISKVYSKSPHRKFFQNGKEIVDKLPNEFSDKEKYLVDEKLFKTVSGLYNKNVITALKQAEKYANLFNTVIYKVNTDVDKKIKLVFISNDLVQVNETFENFDCVDQIAFVKQMFEDSSRNIVQTFKEFWSTESRMIPELKKEGKITEGVEKVNEAGIEAKKLFGHNSIGYAFAPFIVFRDSIADTSFWNVKDKDTYDFIKSINLLFAELRYLARYTSFGLKYTVNIKEPKNRILDPTGVAMFAVENSGIPGNDLTRNWEIGEFPNAGRIKEVIESIIFFLKMLYEMYNIKLDSLISTNSVRSADSKEKDNETLFEFIKEKREIWEVNEQNLFKVMQAVHNRDNIGNKIPAGIELVLDYDELTSVKKTNQDWVLEIQNNVSSIVDWISSIYPKYNKQELMKMFLENKKINEVNTPNEEMMKAGADVMKVRENIDAQKGVSKEKEQNNV